MFGRAYRFVRDIFGSPHPSPHHVLLALSNDLTPNEMKAEAERQMHEVMLRLERLRAEVDVHRRGA